MNHRDHPSHTAIRAGRAEHIEGEVSRVKLHEILRATTHFEKEDHIGPVHKAVEQAPLGAVAVQRGLLAASARQQGRCVPCPKSEGAEAREQQHAADGSANNATTRGRTSNARSIGGRRSLRRGAWGARLMSTSVGVGRGGAPHKRKLWTGGRLQRPGRPSCVSVGGDVGLARRARSEGHLGVVQRVLTTRPKFGMQRCAHRTALWRELCGEHCAASHAEGPGGAISASSADPGGGAEAASSGHSGSRARASRTSSGMSSSASMVVTLKLCESSVQPTLAIIWDSSALSSTK